MGADQHLLFCFVFVFFFLSCCGLWCGGGCGCVGSSALVGGWVHRWVAGLWVSISTSCFVFVSLAVGYGLWCDGGCGCVGRLASVGGWIHRWVARLLVGLWVDRCVRGGGLGGFHGGGCGCCLVGLVGVDLVDFFFLCCGLWWWWSLWLWLWLWLCV